MVVTESRRIVVQLALWPTRPGKNWQTCEPYCEEVGKSAPGEIEIDGRIYEYVPGSLLTGTAEYRERQEIQQ